MLNAQGNVPFCIWRNLQTYAIAAVHGKNWHLKQSYQHFSIDLITQVTKIILHSLQFSSTLISKMQISSHWPESTAQNYKQSISWKFWHIKTSQNKAFLQDHSWNRPLDHPSLFLFTQYPTRQHHSNHSLVIWPRHIRRVFTSKLSEIGMVYWIHIYKLLKLKDLLDI